MSLQSILCYSTPKTHPYISDEELKYLNEHVTSADTTNVRDPVPWRAIVRSVPVWALLFAAVSFLFFINSASKCWNNITLPLRDIHTQIQNIVPATSTLASKICVVRSNVSIAMCQISVQL